MTYCGWNTTTTTSATDPGYYTGYKVVYNNTLTLPTNSTATTTTTYITQTNGYVGTTSTSSQNVEALNAQARRIYKKSRQVPVSELNLDTDLIKTLTDNSVKEMILAEDKRAMEQLNLALDYSKPRMKDEDCLARYHFARGYNTGKEMSNSSGGYEYKRDPDGRRYLRDPDGNAFLNSDELERAQSLFSRDVKKLTKLAVQKDRNQVLVDNSSIGDD